MKNFLTLLLLFVALAYSTTATAQRRHKIKAKRAFSHNSESSRGKNNRAHFRPENNIKPVIDLNPRSPEKFKTAKASKNYKFSNGRGVK